MHVNHALWDRVNMCFSPTVKILLLVLEFSVFSRHHCLSSLTTVDKSQSVLDGEYNNFNFYNLALIYLSSLLRPVSQQVYNMRIRINFFFNIHFFKPLFTCLLSPLTDIHFLLLVRLYSPELSTTFEILPLPLLTIATKMTTIIYRAITLCQEMFYHQNNPTK